MNNLECVACGDHDIQQTHLALDNGKYILMKCCACGLKFFVSDNFETLDDDSYWDEVNKKIYSMPEVLADFKEKQNKYLRKITKRSPSNKKLLDVGSGSGIFLDNARLAGFDVTGIEPSAIAIDLCTQLYGLPTISGYLEVDSDLPKDFGVVSAWDVIEHVANPKDFLKICHAHLEQGGTLILETPDESSLIRKFINAVDYVKRMLKIGGQSYIYYDSHRYYFTHKSFGILLDDVGFKNIKIYKEHSIYSKAIAKNDLYKSLSTTQRMKYRLIFFILKLPIFWNKQVILCTKK